MPHYLYYCAYCDCSFEISKSMAKSSNEELCPKCGIKSQRRYTPIPFSFGWRLQDKCHEIGGPKWAEIEPDV